MVDTSASSKLTRSAGFVLHDYLPEGASEHERVIYTSLPAICLSSTKPSGEFGFWVAIDETLNTTVYADLVYVAGTLKLPGRNIKIVARKLKFIGDTIGIVTDGHDGEAPLNPAAAPKPAPAASGRPGRADGKVDGGDGASGFSATDRDNDRRLRIADGASGRPGTKAGNIEIYVEKWVGNATLSANGGHGAPGQDGQDGQDGGDGGDGDEAEYDLHPPEGPP